jgi:hypothetical protein
LRSRYVFVPARASMHTLSTTPSMARQGVGLCVL